MSNIDEGSIGRRTPLRPGELVRAATIARRHYLDGASKVTIAEEFGISRFKVARILDEARRAGLVRVEIAAPAQIDTALSEELRSRYDLKDAIVVAAGEASATSMRRAVGGMAAEYFNEVVSEGDVVGLACSRTLQEMVFALDSLPRITVVQLTGVHPGGVEENSVELVRRVATLARGPALPIYAPLLLPRPADTHGLRKSPQVADATRRYTDLSKAIVGIGSWDPPESLVHESLSPAEREALRERGARAEACARLVDSSGRPIDALDDRVIAIELDQLQQVPDVIAVACGAVKAAAIRAILTAGFVTALVTDTEAARLLTEGATAPSP